MVTRLTGRGWAAAIYPAGGDPSPQRTRTACATCPAKCTISDALFYPYLYGYILLKALTIHIYMDII
nr:MAG TPA: hypothetical protein [Caudoviricetes sp.]